MNIMNPPADWSTMKKLIWLRGTPITGGEELTVSGTPPLSLPNALGKPLKAWEVDVLPKQNLNGYANPWPAGGGKNLLGSKESKTFDIPASNASFTFEKSSSHVIFTTSGLPSSLGYRFTDIDLKCTLPAGTYYFSSNISNQNEGSGLFVFNADTSAILARARLEGGGSFTLSETATVRLGASLNIGTVSGTYWFQLESGSSATTFVPYSNICPIYGTDKLNLFVEESYDPAATPKVVITLDNTVYGGTYDAVTGEGTITHGIYTFTGNETWQHQVVGGSELDKYFTIAPNSGYLVPDAKVPRDNTYAVPIRTSIGEFNRSYYTLQYNPYEMCIAADHRIGIHSTLYTGAGTLQGVQMYYELATPIPFTFPPTEVSTSKGDNYAWATAEDGIVESMEVTYVGKA